MKKAFGVAALAAVFATSAMAADLDVSIGNLTGTQGGIRTLDVTASLTAGSGGLALIGANVTLTPSGGAPDLDLCNPAVFLVEAPLAMQSFERKDLSGPGYSNDGLTNPQDLGNPGDLSGYAGTCDGNMELLQIGGGQNTIGNTPGGAPYPIGTVVSGIADGGADVIATLTIDTATLTTGAWEICVDTVFANTLDTPVSGPPYAVSEATVVNEGCFQITAGIVCPDQDVNCDGNINALDLGVVTGGLNWQQSPPACDRADVNNDGSANALDLGQITNGLVWQTSHGACSCSTSTPGVGGCPN